MKIALIGLGNMGLPMAANLLKAGHEVTGFDLSAELHLKFDAVAVAYRRSLIEFGFEI